MTYSKALDMLVGATGSFTDISADKSIESQMDCEGMLIYFRSMTHGDFRFPVGIIDLANNTSKHLMDTLKPFLENLNKTLRKHGDRLIMCICDGHRSHIKVCSFVLILFCFLFFFAHLYVFMLYDSCGLHSVAKSAERDWNTDET